MKNEQLFLNIFFIFAVGITVYLSYSYEHYKAAMVFSIILGALLTYFVRLFKR